MKKIILFILCAGVLAACDIADIRSTTKRYTYYLVASEHWNAEDLLGYDPQELPLIGLFYRDIGPDMDRNRPGGWRTSFGIEKPIVGKCGEVSGYYLFEQGYEYVIKICIRTWVPRTDIMDDWGSSCTLVEVISKEPAETHIDPELISIVGPGQMGSCW